MELSFLDYNDFKPTLASAFAKYCKLIETNRWQAISLEGKPWNKLYELQGLTLIFFRPHLFHSNGLPRLVGSDIEWAREHFNERVSRVASNPQPSEARWPYGDGSNDKFKDHSNAHSHTYSERFWPNAVYEHTMSGIRYQYGDLDDVVATLVKDPGTRQAVLPIWFPEDTISNGVRKPCSLFYHFLPDGNRLNLFYSIRSCDIYRHLVNDIFFAACLLEWVIQRASEQGVTYEMGRFQMSIGSLHLFAADKHHMPEFLQKLKEEGK